MMACLTALATPISHVWPITQQLTCLPSLSTYEVLLVTFLSLINISSNRFEWNFQQMLVMEQRTDVSKFGKALGFRGILTFDLTQIKRPSGFESNWLCHNFVSHLPVFAQVDVSVGGGISCWWGSELSPLSQCRSRPVSLHFQFHRFQIRSRISQVSHH